MTPTDPAVLRRKLAMIVGNLQALNRIASWPLARYQEDLFARKATERLLQELIKAQELYPKYVAALEAYLRAQA